MVLRVTESWPGSSEEMDSRLARLLRHGRAPGIPILRVNQDWVDRRSGKVLLTIGLRVTLPLSEHALQVSGERYTRSAVTQLLPRRTTSHAPGWSLDASHCSDESRILQVRATWAYIALASDSAVSSNRSLTVNTSTDDPAHCPTPPLDIFHR